MRVWSSGQHVYMADFHMRDNVSRFIMWVRALGVDFSVLFEADDLVAVSFFIIVLCLHCFPYSHPCRTRMKRTCSTGERCILGVLTFSLMELARVQNGVEHPKVNI